MRRIPAPALSFLLIACHKDERGKIPSDDTAATRDTGSLGDPDPDCDSGQLDDDGECVPAACGTGTWGDLEADESTVYVDIAATEGGDGSEVAPFTSIQAGLDAAGAAGGGLVAVAAGTYPESLALNSEHAGAHLAGRCRDLVTIDASVGDEETTGLRIDPEAGEVEVSGVAVRDSHHLGVLVGSGNVRIRDCTVDGNEYIGIAAVQLGSQATALSVESCDVQGNALGGILAYDPGTSVTLHDTIIQDTQPAEDGVAGIWVFGGASLTMESCEVVGNSGLGLVAIDSDTSVSLGETAFRDTQPSGDDEPGMAILAYSGASLAMESCEVVENASVGVTVHGTGTTASLREVIVRDTLLSEDGVFGDGIMVYGAASLVAEACVVEGNPRGGLSISESGTTVILLDTTVQGAHPEVSAGHTGYGIQVMEGASFTAESCEVAGSQLGVVAFDSGTAVTLSETTIRDTVPDDSGKFGYGIEIRSGASLAMESCDVLGSTHAGVVVSDSGSSATIEDSTIAFTKRGEIYTVGMGIGVQPNAVIEASELVLSSNEGPGILLAGEGASLTCVNCSLSDNEFAGAVVAWESSLALENSTVEGTIADENVGGGVGIYAEALGGGPPTLSITNTTIQQNPVAGIWLSGQGAYSLSNNVIHGGDGWIRESLSKCGDAVYAREGVTAWDGGSGLLLQNNELLHGLGAGLLLDNSSATLSGNSYADNAVDLVTQGTDCATPPDGYQDEAIGSAELCPSYDYATCGDEFSLYLELVEPKSG